MRLLAFFLISLSFSVFSAEVEKKDIAPDNGNLKKVMGEVQYFRQIFGVVHQNTSRYSTALTTISCNHPVKLIRLVDAKGKEVASNDTWAFVKVGAYEGYLVRENLAKQKNDCFQDRYPKFFDSFEPDLSELYYWGRLYDQYVNGKSKVR